jgi:hypothetical protein
MTEATFRKDLQKGMQAQGAYVLKLPDLARAVVKPFDLLVAHAGCFYPMELKLRKVERAKPLHNEDVAISQKVFRPHQLPTLLEIHQKLWGFPYVGACLVRVQDGRVQEKQAWLIPISLFLLQEEWNVASLNWICSTSNLQWKPGVGWLVSWLGKIR